MNINKFLLFIVPVLISCLTGCKTTNDHLVDQSLIKMREDHHQEQLDKQHRRDLETLTVGALTKVATSARTYRTQSTPEMRILPPIPEELTDGYISIGSTKEEVLAIHGTPKEYSEFYNTQFLVYPDYSTITLKNNRVVSFQNYGFLRIKLS